MSGAPGPVQANPFFSTMTFMWRSGFGYAG